jgi:predicted dienelactone hydrolase
MRSRFMLFSTLYVCFAAFAAQPGVAAQDPAALNPVEVRADYPELAQRGSFPVGYRQIEVVDPHRIDFLHSDLAAGKVTFYDRRLYVTVWYPAAGGDTKTVAHYDRHPGAGVGSPYAESAQFPETGLAIADAAPLKSKAPLVIYSHGFTNWAAHISPLAEVLASRGYVVASIDHDDIPYKDGKGIGLAFVDTASGRVRDLRAVALRLRALSADASFPLAGAYDPDHLALMGYSMGGYGVLTAASGGFDPNGPLFQRLPKAIFEGEMEGQMQPIPGVEALVLFAPWGGQPGNRAWSAAELASVKVPTMVVDGDHDDIAGYQDGVRWIFDNLKSSDRYMLVLENARHNIVGVEAPKAAQDSLSKVQKWDEPVWRKDRIEAIDAHFVVAFLDRTLRHDASMDSYLNPSTPHSNDGTWPETPMANSGSAEASPYAGHDPGSSNYWKGFQRRWALGLELEHAKPSN